ncbi:MAG: hypothetical protein ABI763_10315 [Bacteroidota bacterium]
MAFEIFPGNSNFTNRIDSFFISAYTADSEKTNPVMFTPELLSATNDYKITILKSGLVYSLTGFETQKESCNNCVWGNDYYTVLKKYYVNGTEKHADYNTLIIDK